MASMKRTIVHYGHLGPELGRLNRLLETFSAGQLQVEACVPKAPATEAEQIGMVRTGEIGFTHFGSMFPATWAPEYDGGGIPFVFPSIEAVEDYWASECGRRAMDLIRERGRAVILGMSRRSPRHLTANIPVTDPRMLRGFKLRIPGIAAWDKVWSAAGASCAVVPQHLVLDQLKSGQLDGQENSLKVIRDFRLYEAQRYIMLTHHIHGHLYWVVNEDLYRELDAEERSAFKLALNVLTSEMDASLETSTRELEGELIGLGCELVRVDAAAFAAASRKGIEAVLSKMAPEVADSICKYIG